MKENLEKEIIKYNNHSISIWIVVLLLAWALGQYVIPITNGAFLGHAFAYTILSIIIGFIIFDVTYEIGKILFGWISNYRLVSTNILGFTFTKNKANKTKFKFGKFTNFGGKTIMAPKKETANLPLYLLGGTLFVIIMNILQIILSNVLAPKINFEEIIYIQYIMSSVALLLLVFHISPFLNDEIYDGFILRLHFANKNFKSQYHKLLLQEEALITNKQPLTYIENVDYSNPVLVKNAIFNYYYLLDNNKEKEAKEEIEKGLKYQQYLSDEDKGKLYSYKYYFLLIEGKEEQVADEYYKLDRSIRKYISNDKDYGTIKTALLIATFVESSYDLYEYILNKIDKEKDKFYISRQDKESELIEYTLNYIERKKIDWFKINEKSE